MKFRISLPLMAVLCFVCSGAFADSSVNTYALGGPNAAIGGGSEGTGSIVLLNYSGVLPTGASAHQGIADGETWAASFAVDNGTGAINSGSIAFSGGHTDTFDTTTTPWGLAIFNDANVPPFVDAVQVNAGMGSGTFFTTQAQFEFTTAPGGPLSTGTPADLVPGLMIDSAGSNTVAYFQLTYTDTVTAEVVSYNAADASNVILNVAIPEPTGFVLIPALGIAALWRRKR